MLESLHSRPRSTRIASLLAAASGGLLAGRPAIAPESVAPPAEVPSDLVEALRAYQPPAYRDELGDVTRALLDRLEDGDADRILAAADPEWREHYESMGALDQKFHLLNFAAYWNVQPALSRTGLTADQPPEDVHAMARGPLAAAGAMWFADLVIDAAKRVGVPLQPGAQVLDFGCSSGRVLRCLAAWRQDVEWVGCDPNSAAASWANETLPDLTAFESPQEPPLLAADASFDLVYAISVWSHFGENQAVRWLDEMHRIVKPGGALVFTTQGFPSLAFYLRGERIPPDHARKAAAGVLTNGHEYVVAFGEDGDWGVKHPEWGMAYMTADWLSERTLPRWSLGLFEPARIDFNQDLVVLVRR